MNIFRMRCFLAVARRLSITVAADEMTISQPAMSSQIASFEKDLGCKLFSRDNKGVLLTYEGKLAKEKIEQIVETYDDLRNQIANYQVDKRLNLGYHGPVNWGDINSIIEEYRRLYPDVKVSVEVGNEMTLLTKLITHRLDLVFIEKEELEIHKNIEFEELPRDYASIAVAHSHPLAQKTSVTIEEVNKERIIMRSNATASRALKAIINRLAKAGIHIHAATFYDDYETTMAAASCGLGVALIPRSFTFGNSTLHYANIISDEAYIDFVMAWRNDNDNKEIENFRKLSRNHIWNN